MPPKQSRFFKPSPEQQNALQASLNAAATSTVPAGAPRRRGFNIPKVDSNASFDLTVPDKEATRATATVAAASGVPPQASGNAGATPANLERFARPAEPTTPAQATPVRTPPVASDITAATQATPPKGLPVSASSTSNTGEIAEKRGADAFKTAAPPQKVQRVEPAPAPVQQVQRVEPAPAPVQQMPARIQQAPAAQGGAQSMLRSLQSSLVGNAPVAAPVGTFAASNPQPEPVLPMFSQPPPRVQPVVPAQASAPRAPAGKAPAAATPATGSGNLPLTGSVFCFTGELESITRADAEDKVKTLGGKIGGSVTGNTNFLVVGSRLDDGRQVEETSKYRKYLEMKGKGAKKCPELLDENQLLAKFPADARPAAPAPLPVAEVPRPKPSAATQITHSNWVDTYAPRGFGDLVSNAAVVRKLTEWLKDWDDVVLKGKKKQVAFRAGGGIPDNPNARAALVSGPPGIGKTTTCRLVAQLSSTYEILEFNASDARGQKVIQEMADGIADNTMINFGGTGGKRVAGFTRRAVIIMDEVDGMGAGDRGGNAALIKMIKKTRNPIICICNDQNSPKIRSLAGNCYDLKFSRPTKDAVAKRCAEISRREGLDVEPNALEALAESCGGDMRMILNQMQALAKSPSYQTKGVKYMDMKDRLTELSKDAAIMISPFDAAKKLLNTSEAARLSLRDRMDMFFVDFSLVSLLVQENYLRASDKRQVDANLLNRCAYSADLMAVSDIMNAKITTNQDWSLLPHVGLVGTVFPTFVTNGFVAFPSFPSFLGKYSTHQRAKRLTVELEVHLRLSSSVGSRHLLTSGYVDLLYNRLMRPLKRGDPSSVNETVDLLDVYGLRKEHLTEHLSEIRQHLGKEDEFKNVDPKVKAAVTREFNSGGHVMKVVLPASKKRKVATDAPMNPDEEMDEEPAAEAEGDDAGSDDGGGGLIKVKKPKAKGKAKAAGTPSPAGRGSGRGRGKAKAKGRA